ncbi:MAG: hypothetical protein LBU51_01970 [Bacteroidales bacterium]|jgi:hypothetical protein|nr:hypothetical protein [Bacteroidales bacterium]
MDSRGPTFDASRTQEFNIENYKPLSFDVSPVDSSKVHELVKYILNHHFNYSLSIGRWKKQSPMRFPEGTIDFDEICKHIIAHRKIDHSRINMPKIQCEWFDSSFSVAPVFNFPSNDSEDSLTMVVDSKLSESYPIKPRIDREGCAISSMQLPLQVELIRIHKELVADSSALFGGNEWLVKLMSFFNICVSLVDITLIQMYYKAKYDYILMGWKFNIDELGETINRPIKEKVKQ